MPTSTHQTSFPAEKDELRVRLLRRWRRVWCSEVDAMWGHLCQDGEGCQR